SIARCRPPPHPDDPARSGVTFYSRELLFEPIGGLGEDVAFTLVETMRVLATGSRAHSKRGGAPVVRPSFGRGREGRPDALATASLIDDKSHDLRLAVPNERPAQLDMRPADHGSCVVGDERGCVLATDHARDALHQLRLAGCVAQLCGQIGHGLRISDAHRANAWNAHPSSDSGGAVRAPALRPSSLIVSSAVRRRSSQAAWMRRPSR